ncbi:hexosaminidase D-like [Gastrophryne carolinensis]
MNCQKIYWLRLAVLLILGLAVIKYLQNSSASTLAWIFVCMAVLVSTLQDKSAIEFCIEVISLRKVPSILEIPPQVLRQVKEDKMHEDVFWGDNVEPRLDPVIKDLPPEPPKEKPADIAPKKKAVNKTDKNINKVPMKLVHLDLKGAPPKVSYFEQIFPLFSKLGANGVLIEYEDMFPFTGELELLKSTHAYSQEDLAKILHLAEINHLEVVPLVQTFGHMEYVLKHDKYRNLREVEQYPNSLNPHNIESLELLKKILTQVLDKHPASSWVHIGADEVYHLGEGQDSKSWLNNNKGDLGKMFLDHLKKVIDFLHAQYPDKRQMMWDDMLRRLRVETIKAAEMTSFISPVLWVYHSDFNMAQIESYISKYESCGFTNIWFASAFKGASTPNQMWTPMHEHMKNHQQWKKVIDQMNKFPKIHYSGIVLTGWQRYDHYSVLCELLPVAIPSLAVCLKMLTHGQFTEEVKKETAQVLGFSNLDPEKNFCDGTGAFPGSEVYGMIRKIHMDLKQKVRKITEEDIEISAWFSHYHRKHQFGNPHKLESFTTKILKTHEYWDSHIQALRTQLESMFFPDTVEEWMEEHVNPLLDPLRQMAKDFQEILALKARPKVL